MSLREDLMALIELFADTHDYLRDPKLADGACYRTCIAFEIMLKELLPELRPLTDVITLTDIEGRCTGHDHVYLYSEMPHPYYLPGCRWRGHHVTRVMNTHIDFTARQFRPDAPFPLVYEGPQ